MPHEPGAPVFKKTRLLYSISTFTSPQIRDTPTSIPPPHPPWRQRIPSPFLLINAPQLLRQIRYRTSNPAIPTPTVAIGWRGASFRRSRTRSRAAMRSAAPSCAPSHLQVPLVAERHRISDRSTIQETTHLEFPLAQAFKDHDQPRITSARSGGGMS